jgi:hypothetical protein
MRQAKQAVGVGAAIYGGRQYPGICEGAECTVNGEDVAQFRERAGLKVAHVECGRCGRAWKRVGE